MPVTSKLDARQYLPQLSDKVSSFAEKEDYIFYPVIVKEAEISFYW